MSADDASVPAHAAAPAAGGDPTLEFIGTATTLLRLGPFTVLTDPNFLHRGDRAHLGYGLWSRRRTEPSAQPADLPPLDAVLLSHLHGDHFDRVARHGLSHDLPVLTTPHARTALRRWGFSHAVGMRTWQSEELERGGAVLRVTSVPGVHAPGPVRHLLPTVMGSVLELRSPGAAPLRVYVSGDTLYRPWLLEVTDRCGPLDAAVVHLGGTKVLGLTVTMDASRGCDLVELLRPLVTVPVHFDDYPVFRSPRSDFEHEWARRGVPGTLRLVERGEVVPLLR